MKTLLRGRLRLTKLFFLIGAIVALLITLPVANGAPVGSRSVLGLAFALGIMVVAALVDAWHWWRNSAHGAIALLGVTIWSVLGLFALTIIAIVVRRMLR